MESYIVRVYRRDQKEPAVLEGLVEVVRGGRKIKFHDSRELWDILVTATVERQTERARSAGSSTGKR